MLFGSYYLAGYMNEKPLARLRDDLAGLGLARIAAASESEDHIAALCDAMRYLIAGVESAPAAGLAGQRDFFIAHLKPWVARFCVEVLQSQQANFYQHVAAFAHEFFEIESEAFEMA